MAEVETKVFPIEALRDFSKRMFLHFGVPKQDAAQAAEVLASADLRGIDSHAVARLHSYFDMLTLGRINPKPEIKVLRSTPTTATVDGDNGLGLVVGPHANRFAMDMAERFGSGWVSVQNTNHFGIAGFYVLKALERDLIGSAMTNSTNLVGPFTPPFALRQEIPKRSVGHGIGHFFGAMQIDGFIDRDSFKRQIDDYIRVFRATKPAPGTNGPLLPGDPEREAEKWRRENGVPLVLPCVDELRDIAQKTGIPFE